MGVTSYLLTGMILQVSVLWNENHPFFNTVPGSFARKALKAVIVARSVGGRNESVKPPEMRLVVCPIIYRVLAPSQVVQDFFHQQYFTPQKVELWSPTSTGRGPSCSVG